MAVIEFDPFPSPLYNVDRNHVVNFLVGLSTLFGGGGEIGSSYMHIIVCQTQSEISTNCEENKDQNKPSVSTNFLNDCVSLLKN